MKKTPKQYTITPAKGQALLHFQGRRFPDTITVFETEVMEEVRTQGTNELLPCDPEGIDLNSDFRNQLIQGDCLSACAYLLSQNIKIDLVYIDPPFASGANYVKKIYLRNGGKSPMEANDNTIGEEVMYRDIWQKEDYLNWIYERLLAIREVMAETASIYVHLDWHIGHYVKILLDEVFGEENFVNEIIWKYDGPGSPSSYRFSQKHETIFRYAKNIDNLFVNELYFEEKIHEYEGRKRFQQDSEGRFFYTLPKGDYSEENILKLNEKGRIHQTKNGNIRIKYFVKKQNDYFYKKNKIQDVWLDLPSLGLVANTNEKTNYSTQKPETLLERIIKASSDEGMIVADFFSGSGTTAKVANDLKRRFIACDIGINALQTTRDRLAKAGADFDVLKIKDGLRLFRNPAQTTARLFSLIDGFKSRADLDLSAFWDGGIAAPNGSYVPVKCVGIHDLLTFDRLDGILEEIYKLEDITNNINQIMIIYAHKEDNIDQRYIDKTLTETAKTEQRIKLISLDQLLAEKRDVLFTLDNAIVKIKEQGNQCRVEIRKFFSPYLFKKIEEYNAKKTNAEIIQKNLNQAVKISDSGLEMIEAIQFDTIMDKVWKSNPELEDKAGIKHKIKGIYILDTDKFKLKIRNIAGDEIIIDSEDIDR